MFMYRISNQPKDLTVLQGPSLSGADHTISVDFNYDGGGIGKGANLVFTIDGKKIAEKKVDATIALRFSLDETFDVGEDSGTPVEFNIYDVPFKFRGLKTVSVDLKEKDKSAMIKEKKFERLLAQVRD